MYDNELKRNGSGYADPTAHKAILNISKGNKKMEKHETPCKGDIYYIERGGTYKPAIIVSGDLVNAEDDVVEVVFLANRVTKKLPTQVEIQLDTTTFAICEHINWFSVDRLGDYISTCTPAEMKAIDEALMLSLGLDGAANADDLICEIEALKDERDCFASELEKRVAQLAECEEANKKLMSIINKREAEIEKLKKENRALIEERKPDIPSAELISLKTERDLYKNLYENMLERVIRKETT
jgi:mRNA-degrading endonuclease toxin of MazEF toxin-antitoxin module